MVQFNPEWEEWEEWFFFLKGISKLKIWIFNINILSHINEKFDRKKTVLDNVNIVFLNSVKGKKLG